MNFDFLPKAPDFSTLPSAPKDSYEARVKRAGEMGYTVDAVGAYNPRSKSKVRLPIMGNGMFAPSEAEQQKGGLLGQLGAALQEDMGKMQGAANRQFERNAGATEDFADVLNQQAPGITATAERTAGDLQGLSDEFGKSGQSTVDSTRAFGERVLGQTDKDVAGVNKAADKGLGFLDTALKYGASAVNKADEAVGGFNEKYQENIKAATVGMQARTQTQLNEINAMKYGDGTPASDAVKNKMKFQLEESTGRQVGEVVSNMWADLSKTMAGLRMGAASTRIQAGQLALGAAGTAGDLAKTKLGAAQTRADVATKVGEQNLQAEQIKKSYGETRGALATARSSVLNSARALVSQFLAQGYEARATMIRENPESVVSLFAALSGIAQVATAPGADKVKGLSFGG